MTTKKAVKTAPKWEIKDRTYYLISERQPITFTLASKHGSRHPLLWFDEEKGHARELRYASNQPSPFIDEQTAKATNQASGNQKLLDLGLTQAEATALTGYTPPTEE